MSVFTGTFLVIISGIAFGTMPLFARIAYAEGVTPESLLFFRFAGAAFIMLMIVALRGEKLPRGRILAGLMLMGGIGYVGQSLSFFVALTMANAGLVALLLYLYPAIVTVLSAVFYGERLSGIRITAVALALTGTALTVGPQLSARPLGIVLGLSAACIYSCYIMAGTSLLKQVKPLNGSAIIMSAAAVVFGGLAVRGGFTYPVSFTGWMGVAALSVISTFFAVAAFMAGLSVIGPTKASVLSTFEPVTTVVLAAFLLGEPIGTWTAAGGILILAAAVMLARSGAVKIRTMK